jgi:hypothetical protein
LTCEPVPGNTDCDRRSPHLREAIRSLLLFENRAGRIERTLSCYLNRPEGSMSSDLQFLEEWIPDRMDPGTVFVLENQSKLGHAQNPYVAVMSCPRCGTMGLITRRQLFAGETLICGGDVCSAEYRLDGETINFRKVQ